MHELRGKILRWAWGAAVLAALAFVGSRLLANLQPHPQRIPDAAIQANAHRIYLAVLIYAADHQGVFPQDAQAATLVVTGAPSVRLPDGPWGGRQEALLPRCRSLGPADHPSVAGTSLGKGERVPVINDCHHFGALVYDVNPSRTRFVVYGIGKRAEQAVVRAVFSAGQEDLNDVRRSHSPAFP